jgi:hypothetical protein
MGPTGGLLATGSGDLKARIWRVSRPAPVLQHNPHGSNQPGLASNNHYDRRKSLAGPNQIPSAGQSLYGSHHLPSSVPIPVASVSPPVAPSLLVPAPGPPSLSPLKRPQVLAPVLALPVVKPVSSEITSTRSPAPPIGTIHPIKPEADIRDNDE